MRTFFAYFTGLLLGLLWITAGIGLPSSVAPTSQVSESEYIACVHSQNEDPPSIADLKQNIQFIEHSGRVRINTPERCKTLVRYHYIHWDGSSNSFHTDHNTIRQYTQYLSFKPIFFSGRSVDYHVFALRKILI